MSAAPVGAAGLGASVQPGYLFRSDSYAWWVLAVLCFSAMVAYVDRQIINLLVEPLKLDLHLSDVSISLLQGFAFAVFHAVLAVPIGRLADARNRQHIILFGIVCWTIACAGSGFAGTFAALFVMRMLVGFGETTLTPAGYSMLSDYFPRDRLGRAISLFLGSGFVGSGLAFIVGGWLLSRLGARATVTLPLVGAVHPWQAAFILVALPGLLCFGLTLTIREPPRSSFGVPRRPGEAPAFSAVLRFIYEQRRSIGAIYVGFSLLAAAQFALGAWTPTFFIRSYGWTASEIGYAYGLYYMIIGTLGVVAGGGFSDWLVRRGYADANLRAGVIAACCALPFVVAFPLMPSGRLALLLLAPATFFSTMPFGAGTAALPLISPNRMRAQIVAMYLLIANLLGQALGPTYVASLTDYFFRDPGQLRYSLAIAAGSLLAVAIAIVASGLASFGRALATAEKADTAKEQPA
jgi:MFS family permease